MPRPKPTHRNTATLTIRQNQYAGYNVEARCGLTLAFNLTFFEALTYATRHQGVNGTVMFATKVRETELAQN